MRKTLTPQEVKLWNWMREVFGPAGFHFRRQVPIGPYVVDFACLRSMLVIEIDGSQHGHDEGIAVDAVRDHFLTAQGFVVLRFWNWQVDQEKDVVIDTIFAALKKE